MRLLRPGTVAERARRRAPRCARRTRSACKAQKPHRASFGATENTFPGFDSGNFSSLLNLRYAFKDALAHGVTVLASSGDDGATDAESDASTLYPFRVNSWPSTDQLVTSVGGTQLNLDDQGNRLSPTWCGTTRSGPAAACPASSSARSSRSAWPGKSARSAVRRTSR